jgi:hypothetical protein
VAGERLGEHRAHLRVLVGVVKLIFDTAMSELIDLVRESAPD